MVAKTRFRLSPVLLLDFLPSALGFLLLSLATAKPLFSGGMALLLLVGFTLADRAKRAVLLEPVLFTDLFQALDILKHPTLCLLWVSSGSVAAIAFVTAGLATVPLLWEPTAWQWRPAPLALALALTALAGWCAIGPLLSRVALAFKKLAPSGDPTRDAALFGPFATIVIYGLLARAERQSRRDYAQVLSERLRARRRNAIAPVPFVLVQCESFFDPRRLHSGIAPDLLPAFDLSRDSSVQWGRLGVLGQGANSTRTEFAVLSGLSEEMIGFDRFNPYRAFARAAVPSLAWRMRKEGYRTICIHPFDRRFYRRDDVMPKLGFDLFLGEEAFPRAERVGNYVADHEVARLAMELVKQEGPNIFVFAITIANHGPWRAIEGAEQVPNFAPTLSDLPEAEAIGHYLHRLKDTDSMIDIMTEGLSESGPGGLLALYGDHLPPFHQAFAHLGFGDRRSDYFIWRAGGGNPVRQDIAAHELGKAAFDALSVDLSALERKRNYAT
jgi:hypothetical protein